MNIRAGVRTRSRTRTRRELAGCCRRRVSLSGSVRELFHGRACPTVRRSTLRKRQPIMALTGSSSLSLSLSHLAPSATPTPASRILIPARRQLEVAVVGEELKETLALSGANQYKLTRSVPFWCYFRLLPAHSFLPNRIPISCLSLSLGLALSLARTRARLSLPKREIQQQLVISGGPNQTRLSSILTSHQLAC